MAHNCWDIESTGFARSVDGNLIDASIPTAKYSFKHCVGCSQESAHHPQNQFANFNNITTALADAKKFPPAIFFKIIQVYIQVLNFIANGIEGLGWKYTTGSNNPLPKQIASYLLSGVSGNTLTLYSNGSNDPRNLSYQLNMPGAEDNPFGTIQTFTTSLQEGDLVEFINSKGGSMGLQGMVQAGPFCNGLSVGQAGVFTVEVFQNAEGGALMYPLPTSPSVNIYRPVALPPLWDYYRDKVIFTGQTATDSFAMSTIVAASYILTFSSPINYFKLKIKIDGIDFTEKIKAEKRIWTSKTQTKIYFGGLNWNGQAQDNLTEGATTVWMRYTYYVDLPNVNIGYGYFKCKNCISCSYVENVGNSVAHGNRSQYCGKPTADAIADFRENCYQHHCSFYEDDEPMTGQQIVDFFNDILVSADLYLEQAMSGFDLRTIGRVKHPSIDSLLGVFNRIPPLDNSPQREYFNEGKFRTKYIAGALLNGLYNFNLLSYDAYRSDYPTEALGNIPSANPDYLIKKSDSNNAVAEDIARKKILPYKRRCGYNSYSGSKVGSGENAMQRGADKIDNIIITVPLNESASNNRCRAEFGSWNDRGEPDTSAAGSYKVKLQINSGILDYGKTVVVGYIYTAYRLDENTIEIHCANKDITLQKPHVPQYAGDGGYNESVNVCVSGNIVERDDPFKENNRGVANLYFGCDEKARIGDSFHLQLSGEFEKFWEITEVAASIGDAQSFIPSEFRPASDFTAGSYSFAKKPVRIVSETSGGNINLTIKANAFCSTCNAERKFDYLYGTDEWICEINGLRITDADFKITSKPVLTASEAFRLRWWNKHTAQTEYQIHFSANLRDILNPSTLQLKIYFDDGTYQIINPNFPFVKIAEDQFDNIGNEGFYIHLRPLFSNQNTILEEAENSDPSTWDTPNYFYPYIVNGEYFIRFHPQYSGCSGEWRFPIPLPDPLPSSSDFYDNNVSGMPGLHADHKQFACKSDILQIYDNGYYGEDLSGLAGMQFTVKKSVVCSYLNESHTIKTTQYATNNFQTATFLDRFKAMGIFLIHYNSILQVARQCFWIKDIYTTTRENMFSARHINELIDMINSIDTIRVRPSGSGFAIGKAANRLLGTTQQTYYWDETHQQAYVYDADAIWGLPYGEDEWRKELTENIYGWHIGTSGGDNISINGIQPSMPHGSTTEQPHPDPIYEPYAPTYNYSERHQRLMNHDDPVPTVFGTDWFYGDGNETHTPLAHGKPWTIKAGAAILTEVKSSSDLLFITPYSIVLFGAASPFNFPEVLRMPDQTEIESAAFDITISNTQIVNLSWVEGGKDGTLTETIISENMDMSLVLVGEKEDLAADEPWNKTQIDLLAIKAVSGVNNDEPVSVDLTDFISMIHAGSGYIGYAILPCPSVINPNFFTSTDWNALWDSFSTTTIINSNPNPTTEPHKNAFRMSAWTGRRIRCGGIQIGWGDIKFALPNIRDIEIPNGNRRAFTNV